jgi:GNAT superfamily N-acetyltransferase
MSWATRLATAADVDALLHLRAAMFAAWDGGHPADPPPPPGDVDWHESARAQLLDGLGTGHLIAAVVDDDEGRPIAGGIAVVSTRLGSPGNPTGLSASISSMFTEPEYRGHGHGSAIVRRLVNELQARGVPVIELFAAPLAEPLYRRIGFDDRPGGAPMRLRT